MIFFIKKTNLLIDLMYRNRDLNTTSTMNLMFSEKSFYCLKILYKLLIEFDYNDSNYIIVKEKEKLFMNFYTCPNLQNLGREIYPNQKP